MNMQKKYKLLTRVILIFIIALSVNLIFKPAPAKAAFCACSYFVKFRETPISPAFTDLEEQCYAGDTEHCASWERDLSADPTVSLEYSASKYPPFCSAVTDCGEIPLVDRVKNNNVPPPYAPPIGCCQAYISGGVLDKCWNTRDGNCQTGENTGHAQQFQTCDTISDCTGKIGSPSESICDFNGCRVCDPTIGCVRSDMSSAKNSLENLSNDLNARKPILQINIPGLNFSNVASSTDDTGTYFYIAWIPELISALYKFGIAIVSIVAVVVIIIQGMRIVTSAGGEGKAAAYKRIMQSVVGLAIAWGSFAILYNINPALVQFNALKVKTVDRMELEETHGCDDPSECGYQANVSGNTIPKGTFTSDLELAKKDRTAPIDYTYFGQVDYTINRTRKLQDIKRFVVHNGGYTAQMNVDTWLGLFKKTGKKTGTHYTINRDGIIYQMIGEEAVAYHANAANNDSIGVELNISSFNGKSCNSLGSGTTAAAVIQACSPTDAQYSALNSLLNDITKRTSLQLNQTSIIGHCEALGATHGDPRAFDWGKIGLNNQDKKELISSRKTPCSWYLPF